MLAAKEKIMKFHDDKMKRGKTEKSREIFLLIRQYFDVKIEYTDITQEEFKTKMNEFNFNLENLFGESRKLELNITKQLESLNYE